MGSYKDLFQSADWKAEKHVPVIESKDKVKKGEYIKFTVAIGRDIPHPNKTEHHIRWIEVYFLPEGEKFPYQISKTEFTSHGESSKGPDTSTVYSHHEVSLTFKTDNPGTIFASSYCNIHGLWENSKYIEVE